MNSSTTYLCKIFSSRPLNKKAGKSIHCLLELAEKKYYPLTHLLMDIVKQTIDVTKTYHSTEWAGLEQKLLRNIRNRINLTLDYGVQAVVQNNGESNIFITKHRPRFVLDPNYV